MDGAPANQLVRYSRAGDSFHYRWAARRCLRMLDPSLDIERITVEGSLESTAAGEYVIDIAEYSKPDHTGRRSIDYFQLKHSTKRVASPFNRSDLTDTLAGFASRYADLRGVGSANTTLDPIRFNFVSNRAVGKALKSAISANACGRKASGQYQQYLEQTTRLRGRRLHDFCGSILFWDDEGNYSAQKRRLQRDLSRYTAGFVHSDRVQSVISLVEDRALPTSEDGRTRGEILKEDVLQRLGVTSERDLFPAPSLLEMPAHPIVREQQQDIFKEICNATGPVIVHAAGGVGKSVVAQQLLEAISNTGRGFIYDCFGGGRYRNQSEPRHRAQDALMQLANEMAIAGLCSPIIGSVSAANVMFREFLTRLDQAASTLRTVDNNACLLIVVDAADNAEMAADEYGDKCFAHLLLRETLPNNCRLVMFCRSERISLLDRGGSVTSLELLPFSQPESASHLRQSYADASASDCIEFHRVTGGNPRVQANAIAASRNVGEVLAHLDPSQNTVAGQIASQLSSAIKSISEHVDKSQVDSICCGLANLPPFVPLDVLARAANVSVRTIRSFVSDLGRPLWLTGDSVQFRDEPTETWFRENFSASKQQVIAFVNAFETLANTSPYVARVLPQLLLRAEEYPRLVDLALSDKWLPDNSAIDRRDIQLYRLQFAFKAALKLGRMADATRLALRAGEEAAGTERQVGLLQDNIDLIAFCQGSNRLQELAYRRVFSAAWDGSSNVFSGSLLSSVEEFRGEARAYLRASENWLQIYFAQRRKRERQQKQLPVSGEQLQDKDIAELAWTCFNLYGAKASAKYVMRWRPGEVVFRVSRLLIRRLVDASKFEDIASIASAGAKNLYLAIAVADELLAVGRFPPKQSLRVSLGLMAGKNTRIPKIKAFAYEDDITPAVLSLAEAGAANHLSRKQILSIVGHYVPMYTGYTLVGPGQKEARRIVFRGVALREALKGVDHIPPSIVIPPTDQAAEFGRGQRLTDQDKQDVLQVAGGLLPWYLCRARALIIASHSFKQEIEKASQASETAIRSRYRVADSLPWEISRVHSDIIVLSSGGSEGDLQPSCKQLLVAEKFAILDRLRLTRAAFRLKRLSALQATLEISCREIIESFTGEPPEEHAGWLTLLARAVLPTSVADAGTYFEQAIEAMSKVGDEHVERWEAVVALARRASRSGRSSPETTYRFVRCAELIGDTVVREKHWDRDDVFRVAAHLNVASAFAAISRWRDRQVGWFDEQLRALAIEAVEAGLLSPRVGWCLSGFSGCNASTEFASVCVKQEGDRRVQQKMIDMAVLDLELSRASSSELEKLRTVALATGISAAVADQALARYSTNNDLVQESEREGRIDSGAASGGEAVDAFALSESINILTSEGIDQASRQFREREGPRDVEGFWRAAIRRVPRGKEVEFQKALMGAVKLDKYDFGYVVLQIRSEWLTIAAVRNGWKGFLEDAGKKLAADLLHSPGGLAYFSERSGLDVSERDVVKGGMIKGLSDSSELLTASIFFNFVRHTASRLADNEVADLLAYSMSRFECHIERNYADGEWGAWLEPPDESTEAVVGLIWSSLGSPFAAIRWQAAHAVRRLAALGCTREIDELIARLSTEDPGAFNSCKLPFYSLHAKLYLLIALARVSVDDTSVLIPHVKLFKNLALDGAPHVLIQKFAADIALRIGRPGRSASEGTAVDRLQRVAKSGFRVKRTKGFQYKIDDFKQLFHNVAQDSAVHLDYDFDRYWLQPLADVFGIAEEEVRELVHDTAVKVLNVPISQGYQNDPRKSQWEHSGRRGGPYSTWHDHGSYPAADSLQFYCSYHAVLSSASRLLRVTPVVSRYGDLHDNPWDDWLSRHTLTRTDGRWLAECRDPSPFLGDNWASGRLNGDWEWEVQAGDFVKKLQEGQLLQKAICISGEWTDTNGSYIEDVCVRSALVSKRDANTAAELMRRSDESHWMTLPSYGETETLDPKALVKVTGWISRHYKLDKRIDGFDPFTREIRWPPLEPGTRYVKMLQLTPDADRRAWKMQSGKGTSLRSEIWSEERPDRQDEIHRSGERMWAELKLLLALCRKTKKCLLVEVSIKRRRESGHGHGGDSGYGYIYPSRKFFVLGDDGILRDRLEQHRLG